MMISRESLASLHDADQAAAEVERVVGPPDAISEGDFNGFVYEYGRATGSGNSPQVEVHFSHDYESRAVAITVRAPYPTVTAEGIGIGATAGAVQRVLGKRESSERETDWGSFGGLFRGDIYDGLSRQSMCVSYDSTGHVNRIDLFITAID